MTQKRIEDAVHIKFVYKQNAERAEEYKNDPHEAILDDWWMECLADSNDVNEGEIPGRRLYRAYRTCAAHLFARLKKAKESGYNICIHLYPDDRLMSGIIPCDEERELYSLFQTENEWFELLLGMSKEEFFKLANNTDVPIEKINSRSKEFDISLICRAMPEHELHFCQIQTPVYLGSTTKLKPTDRFYDSFDAACHATASLGKILNTSEPFHSFMEIYEILLKAKQENVNVGVQISAYQYNSPLNPHGWHFDEDYAFISSIAHTEDDWFKIALDTTKEAYFKAHNIDKDNQTGPNPN